MFECDVFGGKCDGAFMVGDATNDVGVLGGIECGELLNDVICVRVGVSLVVRRLYLRLVHLF